MPVSPLSTDSRLTDRLEGFRPRSGSNLAGLLHCCVALCSAVVLLGADPGKATPPPYPAAPVNGAAEISSSVADVLDLEVRVDESVDPANGGSDPNNLTYTVTILNHGPAAATGVTVENALTLPPGVAVGTITPDPGTSADAPGDDGIFGWSVGGLAAGAEAKLEIGLSVGSSVSPGTDVIANTATLSAVDQTDSDPANDQATEATSIAQPVDLALAITESSDPALPIDGEGGFVYTLTVTNQGPGTATNVAVLASVRTLSGVTVHGFDVDQGSLVLPDWTIGDLAPGAVATLQAALTIGGGVQDTTDLLSLTAFVTGVDQLDSNTSNDSIVEATETRAFDCYEVTTTADSGLGSLRQALECANGYGGSQTISFAIPGVGPHVISPATALPMVISPVILDGTSQTGNEEACSALDSPAFTHRLVLDGGGGDFDGLILGAGSDGSEVVGFDIRNFGLSGIEIADSGNNLVACNFVGTDEHGTAEMGNGQQGVELRNGSSNNTVRLNLISGNDENGLLMTNAGTLGNQIRENRVGTDRSGSSALGNRRGIQISNGATGNTVTFNLISANDANGLRVVNSSTVGNLMENNLIGTDASGSLPLGNGAHSISVQDVDGTNTVRRNTIAAGATNGIRIDGSHGTLVLGNWIGTNSAEATGLGHTGSGVLIENDSTNNLLRLNEIAFNAQDGIRVRHDGTFGNSFSENRLFSNGQSGIDLASDGATPNDADDVDAGPNALQNYPEPGLILLDGSGQLTTTLRVDSAAAHSAYPLTVEFFVADDDGEEGRGFLAAITYSTPGVGATETFDTEEPLVPGDLVVATVTDSAGNTSELSTAMPVIATTDLAVAIDESSSSVIAGVDTLIYTATVTNQGPFDATGVVLETSLTLPPGVSLESAVPSAGAFSDPVWTLGDLAADASESLELTLLVDAATSGGRDEIAASLVLTELDQVDIDSANDEASEATSVVDFASCLKVTTTGSGLGSLSQAITCANARSGLDAITFEIPGTGPHVITAIDLPRISDPLSIDGASQPGNEGVCTLPIPDRPPYQIVLDGNQVPVEALVLDIGSDGSTIQGLNIRRYFGTSAAGIRIRQSHDHTIRCNFLGTNETGTAARGNWLGLRVDDGANNLLGGSAPGDGNLISGNIFEGVLIRKAASTNNRLWGNFVGTKASGDEALKNQYGVRISNAPGNFIGDAQAGAGNLISGNNNFGVAIQGMDATGTVVRGNRIGTNLAGTAGLSSGAFGVAFETVIGGIVGGIEPGEGNTIGFHGTAGVALVDPESDRQIRIEGNSIFENGGSGIDLSPNGGPFNDPGDSDEGPNRLQNFPELLAYEQHDQGVSVTYHVDSDPANQSYPLRVLFYIPDADYEEGRALIAADSYTEADHADCGAPPCAKTFEVASFFGQTLLATATDADGNTSEFSVMRANLLATKTVLVAGIGTGGASDENMDGTPAHPGDVLGYTITLVNLGSAPTSALSLHLDPDPATGLIPFSTVVSGDIGANVDDTSGVLDATLHRPLPPWGGTTVLSFDMLIDPSLPPGEHSVCNQATVFIEGGDAISTDDPDLPTEDDPTCITVSVAPDLGLTKGDGGIIVRPGDSLSYLLGFENTGSRDATGVVLTQTVPARTTFDAGASTAGWACSPDANAGSICTLDIGALSTDSGSASATFSVLVDSPYAGAEPLIESTASIADDGANGNDPTPENNTVTVLTPVDLPPTVSRVDTVSSSRHGELIHEQVVVMPVTQVYVHFSEDVLGADAATSFLMVEAGPDGTISSLSCAAGVERDDVAIAIESASYGQQTARLDLSADSALARGRYRVLACGSGISDSGSQSLDGDGNGGAGGDFRIDFVVPETGLLSNPNFDRASSPWTSSDFQWDSEDIDQAPTSGSMEVIAPIGVRGLDHPCLAIAGQTGLSGSLATRIDDPSAGSPMVGLVLDFFSAAGCTGTLVESRAIAGIEGDTGGWQSSSGPTAVPAGAVSVLPRLVFGAEGSSPSAVRVDRVQLIPILFGDGFESGDTSAWSTSSP